MRQVPFDRVAEAVTAQTRLVAVSLVQSQGGRTADLPAIVAAARRHGARVVVDATHGLPFYRVDGLLVGIDVLICHAYKHMLCPRGAGFMYVRRDAQAEFPPVHANWSSIDARDSRSYGGPLTVARDARRFDVSLDWLAWVGARESVALIVQWQEAGVLAEARQLAVDLARKLGEPDPGASVVSVAVENASAVLAALRAEGIRAGAPGGRIRLAPHVYNTPEEIDRVVAVLSPYVVRAAA